MTQATEAPAELTGPTGRAAKIAAIYAFAHWLIEHPDVPAPTRITASWWTHVAEEVDEPTRMAGLQAVADQLGERVSGNPTSVYLFSHRVASEDQHGVGIDYQGAMTTDAYERQRAAGRF
jgi:hypothetical protein